MAGNGQGLGLLPEARVIIDDSSVEKRYKAETIFQNPSVIV
jgi:hypothetical protein